MATRSRKDTLRYRKDLKANHYDDCVFCLIEREPEIIVQTTKSFHILFNKYPYTHWDLQTVEEHLLIVPKKHTDTMSDLTASEAIEYVQLVGSYESQGYSVYSRSPKSPLKSVVHQHTHLLKLTPKESKFFIFSKKPYFRIVK